jgi:uncharacterized protein affecting Mg2+/Co2+ transport
MNDTADYAIDIDVATRFLDDQSAPDESRFVFAYTIHIRNRGKVPARLCKGKGDSHDTSGGTPPVETGGVPRIPYLMAPLARSTVAKPFDVLSRKALNSSP